MTQHLRRRYGTGDLHFINSIESFRLSFRLADYSAKRFLQATDRAYSLEL